MELPDWLFAVYCDTALEAASRETPGIQLGEWLDSRPSGLIDASKLRTKLAQSCGKLCLMWQAADWALQTEQDFWTATVQEAPALFGAEAVVVRYHLEACVLFARSALDISAAVFGALLPDPFPRASVDSFNKLAKKISRYGSPDLALYIDQLRESETSWLSVLCGRERRSLRDKISHQTEFPLEYEDLREGSEKEYAAVLVGDKSVSLPEFLQSVRDGVMEGFCRLELACIEPRTP